MHSRLSVPVPAAVDFHESNIDSTFHHLHRLDFFPQLMANDLAQVETGHSRIA